MKTALLDPLFLGRDGRHSHYIRDWTGSRLPADVCLPPLELMYAAAYLRERGHEAVIVEANIRHWPHERTAARVKEYAPDLVLIPSVSFGIASDKRLASLVRAAVPRAKIVFSGPRVTFRPEEVLADGTADYVAMGELELPLAGILEGRAGDNVARLESGRIVTGSRTLLGLDELALPARDLIDNSAYRYAIFNRGNPVTSMTVSRGCPYGKCAFCHSQLYSLGQVRYRSLDAIKEELRQIAAYGIGEIFFRDQVFTADRELTERICGHMIDSRMRIPWRAETRVDYVDRELLALMRRAGCYQLSFGFETGCQAALDLNNKGITVEQSYRAARWAKEAGIETVGLFIYGMPGETGESLRRQLRFALDLRVDYANFEAIYFMPGSPIYNKAAQGAAAPGFSRAGLKAMVRKAYCAFYLRPSFVLRQLGRMAAGCRPAGSC
jgi:radical SAM superfamily enzyme YgiQ (UPF0313 family)